MRKNTLKAGLLAAVTMLSITTQAGFVVSQDGVHMNGGGWTVSSRDQLMGWTVTETGVDMHGLNDTQAFASDADTTWEQGNYGTGTRIGRDWFRDAAASLDTNGADLDASYSWFSAGDTIDFSSGSSSSAVFSETSGMTNGANWFVITMDNAPINYTGYTAELGGISEIAIQLSWNDADSSGTRSVGDVYTMGAIIYATGTDTFNGKTVAELTAMLPQPSPQGLSATAGFSSVSLNWLDIDDPDFDYYKVYRSTASGTNYVQIATGLTSSDYQDNTAVNGTNYYYVATSVNTFGSESDYSSEASAQPTDVPTDLVATAGNSSVSLDWADSLNPDFDFFTVYRSTTTGTNYTAIASNLTVSAYTDNSVVNGTNYYYVITQTDTLAAESGYSAEAWAKPEAPAIIKLDLGQLCEEYTYTNKYNPIQTVGAADNWNGILSAFDPSDNDGRMTRFYLRFTETENRINGAAWLIPEGGTVGYIGEDVINESDPESSNLSFDMSALDTIMWYVMPRETDSFANQTPYNEFAIALRFTDTDLSGGKTVGDTMEVLGIIYSQGTSTLFGMTANELTAMLNLSATAFDTWGSGFGLSGTQAEHNADPDQDGVKNLAEYAFGGNPTNAASQGELPTIVMDDAGLKYVYRIITDASVAHQITTTTNLVAGGGSITVTPLSTNEVAGYNIYTNAVDTTTEDLGFLDLELTYE